MVGIISDIGNGRKVNEDFADYYIDKGICLYVIADGMGGHNAGEVASKMAVQNTIDYIKSIQNIENTQKALKEAIYESNRRIFEKSKEDIHLSGMGTTITACLVKSNEMVVANVGDSSCYIMKNDSLIKVTKDHSLVQQLIDEGSITEEQAIKHPNKNIITRALGTKDTVDVDIFVFDLSYVNKILLCTDGLSNSVSAKEMYDIIKSNDNEASCKKLIELSKSAGSRDNISVIIFEGKCEI